MIGRRPRLRTCSSGALETGNHRGITAEALVSEPFGRVGQQAIVDRSRAAILRPSMPCRITANSVRLSMSAAAARVAGRSARRFRG